MSARPDRRQVWRHIAVDRTDLPMPREITVSDNGVIALNFDRYDELVSFSSALGEVERRKERFVQSDGRLFSYFSFDGFLGYHGYATCHEDAPATVDYLPEPESLAKVSDARVDEMLDILNGFVAHEYEQGTEIHGARLVVVQDRVGILDEGFASAFEWLALQPESAVLTNGKDCHEAELKDGSVLFWEPSEKQWTVAAMDVSPATFVPEHGESVAR